MQRSTGVNGKMRECGETVFGRRGQGGNPDAALIRVVTPDFRSLAGLETGFFCPDYLFRYEQIGGQAEQLPVSSRRNKNMRKKEKKWQTRN